MRPLIFSALPFLVLATGLALAARAPESQEAAPEEGDASQLKPGDLRPLSTALRCVLSLLFLYFLVVIILKIVSFTSEIQKLSSAIRRDGDVSQEQQGLLGGGVKSGGALSKSRACGYCTDVFSVARLQQVMMNMSLVPMFCVLLTFCRLRARIDLDTEPQTYAKNAMVAATLCLFAQILWTAVDSALGACCSSAGGQRSLTYLTMAINVIATAGLCVDIVIICVGVVDLRYQQDQIESNATVS